MKRIDKVLVTCIDDIEAGKTTIENASNATESSALSWNLY